jgi:hypothetical protein
MAAAREGAAPSIAGRGARGERDRAQATPSDQRRQSRFQRHRALLREEQMARLETGLALLAGLHLLRVRDLLDGINKSGLAALCGVQASGASHDIAIRVVLAERGNDGSDPEGTNFSETIAAAQHQFDQIRSVRAQMSTWFRS